METYCVTCRKNAANKNSSVRRDEQNRLMIYQTVLFMARKIKIN